MTNCADARILVLHAFACQGQFCRLLRHVCTQVTGQMVTMVDVILGGVLERFPQLKAAFLAWPHGPSLGKAVKK